MHSIEPNAGRFKIKQLCGKTFGVLTVSSEYENRGSGSSKKIYWKCRCTCGKEKWIRGTSLASGSTLSCGCKRTHAISVKATGRQSPNLRDLSGQRFGRLLVTEECIRQSSGVSKVTKWKCTCDCGNQKWIQTSSLTSQTRPTQSCGCLAKELASKANSIEIGLAAKHQVYWQYKLRANKKMLQFDLTLEDFVRLTQFNCRYCGSPPSNKKSQSKHMRGFFTYNGVDRIDNEEGYVLDNCTACCKICNRAKDVLTRDEFLDWVKKVYDYNT